MSKITLRDYQIAATAAAQDAVSNDKKPVISLPTGSGKSLVLAELCRQRPGRTLVISHRKELLQQDQQALNQWDPSISSGIYCAGLNQRDRHQRVIFGGVASIYKRLQELQIYGAFDTIIIDEAHLVAPKDGNGIMYRACLDALPYARLIGLTATPYRLDSGLLHEGENAWFDDLCIHIPPSDLVQAGYLAPLIGIQTKRELDVSGVHIRAGDFIESELAQIANNEVLLRHTLHELLDLAKGRNHGIIFAINLDHADMITKMLKDEHKEDVHQVDSRTHPRVRANTLVNFKSKKIRWLVNVGVATTGFDAPCTDVIAMLRPTLSKGLYVQCIGRGMRRAEAKADCLVLDFAGNIHRHGNLDMLIEYRTDATKPQREAQAREAREARERQFKHASHAFTGDPMTGSESLREVRVRQVKYKLAAAKSQPGKTNLVVDYDCDTLTVRQWLCVEYAKGPRWHAEQWFKRRGLRAPLTASAAIQVARQATNPSSLSIYFEDFGGHHYPKVALEHFHDEQQQLEECA